ncbi:hypothetical protein [Geothrix edaphica]|uniref:Uncharacterized protein n=1 Tax=Geothrix edaphica TaxID=2927976 RepID=A0ABQ5PYQ7_9BACT|nr:hypothetical protein [Geothrix edaphica]GLH67309.1 hypothetical protein GETHED_16730 [Geothrix edaphica]
MSEQERIKAAEVALYESSRTFQALRSVAFLLSQAEGKGPFTWDGQPMEDLQHLLDVLAIRGIEHSEAGYDALTDPNLKTA